MSDSPAVFAYDAVEYPDKPFRQATPDRLATLAAWFGMTPASPMKCRVLEVGCGAGGNLIPLADRFPESSYLGFDLALKPIELAKRDVATLGLNNIEFRQLDIMEFPEDAGEFDFIIAHGFYAWVPAIVREKLLAVCQRHLSPNGVAYISYNAYPGGHFRNIWRDLMLFHTRGMEDVGEKLHQARAAMQLLVDSLAQPDTEHRLAAEDCARFSTVDENVLFHDDMADFFEPCYFHDFAARAAGFGMQYLAEATIPDMEPRGLSPEALAAASEARKQDVILYEQYLDFFLFRRFRQTLLCRSDIKLDRNPPAGIMKNFQWASASMVVPTTDPSAPKDAQTFFSPHHKANAASNNPALVSLMNRLIDAWPGTLAFDAATAGLDPDAAAGLLMQLAKAGLVEPSIEARTIPLAVSDRPEIWRVARHQAKRQAMLTSLYHGVVDVTEEASRQGLQRIDGTKSLDELKKTFGPGIVGNLEQLAKSGLVIR